MSFRQYLLIMFIVIIINFALMIYAHEELRYYIALPLIASMYAVRELVFMKD